MEKCRNTLAIRFVFMLLFMIAFLGVSGTHSVSAAVKLNAKSKTVYKAESYNLKLSGTTKKVTYSSSNSGIAKVDKSTGKITAVSVGSTTVKAKSNGKTYTCKVKVTLPTYKVSSGSKCYNSTKKNTSGSDYMLNSYMKQLEKAGGGTITLKKGTYKLNKTVFVPSNVKVIFSKGVVLEKGTDTGFNYIMFGFVPPSQVAGATNADPNPVYGYEGAHDITFVGYDNKIEMYGVGITFCLGHCKNISISGFKMYDMDGKSHHFIECNSSQKVTIQNCYMYADTRYGSYYKECINVDADETGGFNTKWASNDHTTCDQIDILNCTFEDASSGIGSHRYSVDSNNKSIYHTNITVKGCSFDTVGMKNVTNSHAIHLECWKDSTVTDNLFINCSGGKAAPIRCDGVKDITITDNTFRKCTSLALTSKYNSKTYKCSNNMIYWTAYCQPSNNTANKPKIYNYFYSTSSKKYLKVKISDSSNNYYECYKKCVTGNQVDNANMVFK